MTNGVSWLGLPIKNSGCYSSRGGDEKGGGKERGGGFYSGKKSMEILNQFETY